MPLVNRTIPNLVQGVSQQPEILRIPSQATAQENGFSSVVEGLKKRPPTNHIAKISSTPFNNAFLHTINRDANERYVVVITDGDIQVFDIDGTEKSVVKQTDALDYLDSSTPQTDYAAVTIADYTFIVNKTKEVNMKSTTSAAKVEEAVYTVNQAINGIKYSLTTNSGTANYTTASTGAISTETIRDNIFNNISTSSNITKTKIGNSSIAITRTSGTLSVSSSDGFGNDASQVIKDTVQQFVDLPYPAIDGMVVEVVGDASNSFDNYFVKYYSSSDIWEETIRPNTKTSIDEKTLYHVLLRTADGNFRFTQVDGTDYTIDSTTYSTPALGERVCGDENSAPEPSFIGRKIKDIFFHRNRLGFLADEAVFMSRAGEFFEYFPETVTQVLDTDPIDVSTSHVKVSILKHAIPFDEELLLFSDQTQFILSGGATLTAGNISINATTEFETSEDAKPVGVGSNVFFPFKKGEFTGFREFFVSGDNDTKSADDITGNVPKFVPKNVFKLATATNENILIALTNEESNAIYVYQYYNQSGKRLQSAWHKWVIGTSDEETILNADFIENIIYLVIERDDGVYLESIDISPALTDDDATYLTHLDRKLKDTDITEVYDAGTNQTTITLPYQIKHTMRVVGRTGASNKAGQQIATVSQTVDGTDIVVSGDITGQNYFVGEEYVFNFTFSQQFIQTADTTGSRISVKEGRLQIRNWTVSFNDTGFFTTEVTPTGRDASTSQFTGTITGSGLLGTVNLEDGDFTFAVQSRNDVLTVKLINDSHLPSNFINAAWEGYYVSQSDNI